MDPLASMVGKFTCPITGKLMEDPVYVDCQEKDTCDRVAVVRHFETSNICPKCHMAVVSKTLTPNRPLQQAIEIWRQRHVQSLVPPPSLTGRTQLYGDTSPSAPPLQVSDEIPLLQHRTLHDAVSKNEEPAVRRLLQDGADVNEEDQHSKAPLFYARSVPIIRLLLEAGATVQQQVGRDNAQKDADLVKALRQQDVVAAKSLLEKGLCDVNARLNAKIDGKTFGGRTPLHQAICGKEPGNITMALLFIRAGASLEAQDDEEWTPLHMAALMGCSPILSVLIVEHVDIDAANKEGMTALAAAASEGHQECVSRLIAARALKDKPDNAGLTSFLHAAKNKQPKTMSLLVEAGANIHARTKTGVTALHYVAQNGMQDWVEFFLSKDFAVDITDDNGVTPAFWAAKGDQLDLLEFLRTRGADLRALSQSGATILHFAAAGNATKCIRCLVNLGLGVNAINHEKSTSLHYASKHGQAAAAQTLLELHADIEAIDNEKMTSLHHAAENRHQCVALVLLNNHANVNCRNTRRATPLLLAAMSGDEGTVRLLIQRKADVHATATISLTVTLQSSSQPYGSFEHTKEVSKWTPLHAAANEGNESIVHILIDAGANPGALTSENYLAQNSTAQTEVGRRIHDFLKFKRQQQDWSCIVQ